MSFGEPTAFSWSARPKTIVGLWLAVSVLLAVAGLSLGMKTVIPGPASKAALLSNPGERFATAAGIPRRDTLFLVLGPAGNTPPHTVLESARDELVGLLKTATGPSRERLFERVETVHHTQLEDDLYLSSDGSRTLIVAETAAPIERSSEELSALVPIVEDFRARRPGVLLSYVSQGTTDAELFALIHRDLDRSLIITLPITFAILLFAFGSVGASLLPLVVALVSLAGSLGAAAVLSHLFGAVNATASQLVVLLVLALGVDYSLFLVSRAREEKAAGRSHLEAIEIARRTTGLSIFWSGLTVALSLFGLFLMNDSILRSMALVSIVAVLYTLAGTLRALPSLLLLCERAIRPTERATGTHPFLRQLLKRSCQRPVLTLVISGALMLMLSTFCLRLRLGSTIEPGLLPRSLESARAYDILKESFPAVSGTDFSILLHGGDLTAPSNDEAVEELIEELQTSHPTVRGPIRVERGEANDTARYSFVALGSPNSPESREIVTSLRERLFVRHLGKASISGWLGGTLPVVVDDSKLYSVRTPIVFGAVLLLSMILLLLAFRSIVVPVKAIALNCLSAGASFGTLVIVFQLFDTAPWHYSVVESFVPALLFSVLFGLSMDYHLLLLSRTREAMQDGLSTREAIIQGIESCSGAITSAALIMVSVFSVLACLELPVMKELGVGLAVAVLLDATIIRSLLLPSSMVLLGRWNWYLPKFLEWLPRVRVE